MRHRLERQCQPFHRHAGDTRHTGNRRAGCFGMGQHARRLRDASPSVDPGHSCVIDRDAEPGNRRRGQARTARSTPAGCVIEIATRVTNWSTRPVRAHWNAACFLPVPDTAPAPFGATLWSPGQSCVSRNTLYCRGLCDRMDTLGNPMRDAQRAGRVAGWVIRADRRSETHTSRQQVASRRATAATASRITSLSSRSNVRPRGVRDDVRAGLRLFLSAACICAAVLLIACLHGWALERQRPAPPAAASEADHDSLDTAGSPGATTSLARSSTRSAHDTDLHAAD